MVTSTILAEFGRERKEGPVVSLSQQDCKFLIPTADDDGMVAVEKGDFVDVSKECDIRATHKGIFYCTFNIWGHEVDLKQHGY